MNGKLILSFVLGAVGGSVGMYFGMKQACESYINKEIDQFKADYEASHECKCEKKCQNDDARKEDVYKEAEKALKKYASATEKSVSSVDSGRKDADLKAKKVNYTKISTPDIEKIDEIDVEQRVDSAVGPVTITPSEYMEDDGLKRVVWNYLPKEHAVYSENGDEEIIDGIEMLGEENLDSFGEFEVDTLYVKNAREGIKIDCILYEDDTYDEFLEEIMI